MHFWRPTIIRHRRRRSRVIVVVFVLLSDQNSERGAL